MKAATTRRRVCCCCIPQDWGVKLWYLWTLVAFVSAVASIAMAPREALPLLPLLCVAWVQVILMAVVFWHPGFDTYGGRTAVFWLWTNGYIAGNLYLSFYHLNLTGWYNSQHYECME